MQVLDLFLSPAELKVWRYLAEHAVGREDAKKLDTISREVGVVRRDVEAALHALVADHKLPIATTSGVPAGAFIALDAADLAIGERNLRGRIIAIARRYRALHGGPAAAELLGQLSMELGAQ